MSDEKRYAERDLQRERQTVARTVLLAHTEMSYKEIDAIARRLFPLQKLTRARVVKDPVSMNGREWRCVGGLMETRLPYAVPCEEREWHRVDVLSTHRDFVEHSPPPAPERVAMWADLLANPTEEVDA